MAKVCEERLPTYEHRRTAEEEEENYFYLLRKAEYNSFE